MLIFFVLYCVFHFHHFNKRDFFHDENVYDLIIKKKEICKKEARVFLNVPTVWMT